MRRVIGLCCRWKATVLIRALVKREGHYSWRYNEMLARSLESKQSRVDKSGFPLKYKHENLISY